MNKYMQAFRNRSEENRTRRAVNRAIANAPTPALRDELIVIAQRDSAR